MKLQLKENESPILVPMSKLKPGKLAVVRSGHSGYIGNVVMRTMHNTVHILGEENEWNDLHNRIECEYLRPGDVIEVCD